MDWKKTSESLRWLTMFGLGAIWNFIAHWFSIFLWAHVCLWELVTGQEVSCPPCWKCTTMRYLLIILYGLAIGMIGAKLWL